MDADTEKLVAFLREAIRQAARSGYGDEAFILDDFVERVRDEFRDHPAQVSAEHERILVDELRAALLTRREAESGWPAETVNDRIEDAFEELEREHGIVALENAGYTMSEGWDDVRAVRDDVAGAWGAVFFHGQDVERGVEGEGLALAFGAFATDASHDRESLRVAETAREVLAKHRVETSWDGSLRSRVVIEPFEWQKRRSPTRSR